MALRHYDGMDHYSDAQKLTSGMWTSFTRSTGFTDINVTGGAGRNGSAAMRITHATNNDTSALYRTLTNVSGNTACFQFAVRFSRFPQVGARYGFFNILDTGNANQITLCMNSDGTLGVRRGGAGGALLATTSTALSVNSYAHIVLKVLISLTVGTVDVWIDNVNRASATGQNTSNTGTTAWSAYSLECQPSGGIPLNALVDIDDIVVMDGVDGLSLSPPQLASFNTFIGDRSVKAIYPTSDGNYVQFSPSSSNPTTHFSYVDENPPTDDTDYNKAGTIGFRDSYGYTIPVGAVSALYPLMYIRQDDAGSRSVTTFARISGVDYDNTDLVLSQTYLFRGHIMTTDPASSSTWTVGAKEFGVKITA